MKIFINRPYQYRPHFHSFSVLRRRTRGRGPRRQRDQWGGQARKRGLATGCSDPQGLRRARAQQNLNGVLPEGASGGRAGTVSPDLPANRARSPVEPGTHAARAPRPASWLPRSRQAAETLLTRGPRGGAASTFKGLQFREKIYNLFNKDCKAIGAL